MVPLEYSLSMHGITQVKVLVKLPKGSGKLTDSGHLFPGTKVLEEDTYIKMLVPARFDADGKPVLVLSTERSVFGIVLDNGGIEHLAVGSDYHVNPHWVVGLIVQEHN